MPRAAPSFPAFDEWQKMSEREQDALLDTLEGAQRRGRFATRLLVGFSGATVAAAIVLTLMLLR
jgi:hypothetical protein